VNETAGLRDFDWRPSTRKSGPNLGRDRFTILMPSRASDATPVSAIKPVAGGSNW